MRIVKKQRASKRGHYKAFLALVLLVPVFDYFYYGPEVMADVAGLIVAGRTLEEKQQQQNVMGLSKDQRIKAVVDAPPAQVDVREEVAAITDSANQVLQVFNSLTSPPVPVNDNQPVRAALSQVRAALPGGTDPLQPLRCADIDTMPKIESKVAQNKCVPQHPFDHSVHAIGDIVSKMILNSGCWEREIITSIVQHFGTVPRHDRTFIDIGGNIGAFTTTMANLGFPTITVEPFRLNVPLMLETLCRNDRTSHGMGDRTKVFKVALSDKSPGQKMCLWSTNSKINNGNARLVPYFEGTKDFGDDKGKTCMEVIHSYTLDEVLGLSGGAASPILSRRPWGLKIDIEGYETLAFRGAAKLFTSEMAPCRIWFEYIQSVTVESGAGATEIFDLLTGQVGYTLNHMNPTKFVPIKTGGPYPDGDYMAVLGIPECR